MLGARGLDLELPHSRMCLPSVIRALSATIRSICHASSCVAPNLVLGFMAISGISIGEPMGYMSCAISTYVMLLLA